MKKGVLILLGLFMMVSFTEAKTVNTVSNTFNKNYSYDNAVSFIERGIEFYIFTNGDFDFNTHINNDSRIRNNRGIIVNRDFRGRITRIGNAFINYDYRGNVTRIGSISMRYRFGKLTNVGDLRVRYDKWGNPNFYGNVRDFYYDNGVRFSINFGDVCSYNDAYFYRNEFRNNYSKFREDKNYYYYKAKPNARIGKRSTILKRRKPVKNITKQRVIKRSSNNSYRKPKNNSTIDARKNINITKNSSIKNRDRVKKNEKNRKSTSTRTKKEIRKEVNNRKRRS